MRLSISLHTALTDSIRPHLLDAIFPMKRVEAVESRKGQRASYFIELMLDYRDSLGRRDLDLAGNHVVESP